MKKMLVLVLDLYQDIELNSFLGTINASASFEEIKIFNPDGKKEIPGSNGFGFVKTNIENPNMEEFDVLYIPGRKMALELRKHKKALNFIEEAANLNKFVVAHCDTPNALYESGLFKEKKYVSYPIAKIDEKSSKLRNTTGALTITDGKYITGRGPLSSFALALETIEKVVSIEAREFSKKVILGME